jgi:hypothetical protein
MVKSGMLIQLMKVGRARYYRYNTKFDMAKFQAANKRRAAADDMRVNGDLYHQMLSEVGYV